MIPIKTRIPLSLTSVGLAIAVSGVLHACGQVDSKEAQPIKIDGSSTVAPITQSIVQAFQSQANNKTAQTLKIKTNISGTGGGFAKFCAGETDINDASRPISKQEMQACDRAQIRYIELPIAFDALTVTVNPRNTWITSLSITELKKIWQPQSQGKVTQWQQVNPTWPNKPLTLYAPDRESGTFDYFTEAIVGQAGASRQDYVFSADDEALVNGVAQDPNALGYFGYAYYEEHQARLKAVAVDAGKGAVLPSRTTVEAGQYQPLSRPLFIYVNAKAAQDNPSVRDFVEFYLDEAPDLVSRVGYIPLPQEGYHLAKIHFQRGKVGTVFAGTSQFDLTLGELLRKQAQF
jgi:phosphate transport system substrate-binding protein